MALVAISHCLAQVLRSRSDAAGVSVAPQKNRNFYNNNLIKTKHYDYRSSKRRREHRARLEEI